MRQLLEAKHATRSEQLSPDQLHLFLQQLKTDQDGNSGSNKEDDPPPASGSGEDKGAGRPRGRHPLAPHLKRQRVEHDLSEAEKHCAECEQDLRLIGEETSERYEYIPAKFVVIEDVCKKYACERTVKTATKPPQPIAKSAAGASLLAQVIVGKLADHLPVHRQGKMMRRLGVDIPDQTMGGWLRQSAELLTPLYERLKEFVLSSKVTGTDDTPVRVLDRSLKRDDAEGAILALHGGPKASRSGVRLHADARTSRTGSIPGRLSRILAGGCLCCLRQLFHRSGTRVDGSGMLGALSRLGRYPAFGR